MSGTFLTNPFRFGAGGAGPALIQTKDTGQQTNNTSIAATFDSAPIENNLLIGIVGFFRAGGLSTVTPTAGWSTAFALNIEAFGGVVVFYKVAGASESSTFTVTFNKDILANGLQIMEWSGMATASPLDVQTSNDETGGTGLVADTGTTAATAQASEVAFAICQFYDDDFNVPGSGDWTDSYTQSKTWSLTNEADGLTIGIAYKILSATGTQNTTLTLSGGTSEERASGIATFKGA